MNQIAKPMSIEGMEEADLEKYRRRWTHILPMIYEPKIPFVLSGECTQTIRRSGNRERREGDPLLIHGKEGKTYLSKWTWRIRAVIAYVKPIWINEDGIYVNRRSDPNPHPLDPAYSDEFVFYPWHSDYCNRLARRDYIVPPTGMTLWEVIKSYYKHGFEDGPEPFEIIRWRDSQRVA